ncbi:hypothetical protein ACFTXJ_37665 [Streptomyces zhihengii]|uniref:hypothetical protein n=1 Tax=Streptomyces zhihengii TaxID=1818004 RepID=UPI003625C378
MLLARAAREAQREAALAVGGREDPQVLGGLRGDLGGRRLAGLLGPGGGQVLVGLVQQRVEGATSISPRLVPAAVASSISLSRAVLASSASAASCSH